MNKKFVISLGGSVLVPDEINIRLLKDFCLLIKKEVKRGNKFVIIVGGGGLCRKYQKAALLAGNASSEDRDFLGIAVTRLNAQLVRTCLDRMAYPEVLTEPSKIEIPADGAAGFFPREEPTQFCEGLCSRLLAGLRKIAGFMYSPPLRSGLAVSPPPEGRGFLPENIKRFGEYPVIVGGGWKPGSSTDLMAVKSAIDFNISKVVNLSNIAYVYTKNPKKDKTAKPIKKLTWAEYFKIIPSKWTPGLNSPFDPSAAQLAQKHNIQVVVANGKNLKNFQNILADKKFKGTTIT